MNNVTPNETASGPTLLYFIRFRDGRRFRIVENRADHIRIRRGDAKPAVEAPALDPFAAATAGLFADAA